MQKKSFFFQLIFLALSLSILIVSCKKKKQDFLSLTKEIVGERDIIVPIYDFDGLEPLLYVDDDRVHVVNFWATWCKPCVEEMPIFEHIDSLYTSDELEVVLVSLDFPEYLTSKLIPFIKKKDIDASVVLLDDPKANIWIPKVDSSWSGALPATLIYSSQKRIFHEGKLSSKELNNQLLKFGLRP